MIARDTGQNGFYKMLDTHFACPTSRAGNLAMKHLNWNAKKTIQPPQTRSKNAVKCRRNFGSFVIL